MEKNNEGNTGTFEQIKSVYKILLFPDMVMQVYYSNIDEVTLKKEYKTMALAVHPDKNPHPKSSQAFIKLNHYYNLAINTKKGLKNKK